MARDAKARSTRRGVNRPRPDDFRGQFVRIGWATVDYYETGWTAVARWVEEDGGDDLRQARRAFTEANALRRRMTVALGHSLASSPNLVAEIMAITDRYTTQIAREAAR
jgi:hypothetical protein